MSTISMDEKGGKVKIEFKWEVIEHNDQCKTWRAKVFGGWILRWETEFFAGQEFICDNGHKWNDDSIIFDINESIDALRLTELANNTLRAAEILTVGDLVKRSASDLMKLQNMGKKSFKCIEEALKERDLHLSEKSISS